MNISNPIMSPKVRAALDNPKTRHLVLEAYLRRKRREENMDMSPSIADLAPNKVVCRKCHKITEITKEDVKAYNREYVCQNGYAIFSCPCGGGGNLQIMYAKDEDK